MDKFMILKYVYDIGFLFVFAFEQCDCFICSNFVESNSCQLRSLWDE